MTLETYLDFLKDSGYKCTQQRSEILSFFLSEQNKLLSAKSVTSHLKNTIGYASNDTVYRNLYLFNKLGIIEITHQDGGNLFYLRRNLRKHEHLIICTSCGKTRTLNICPMPVNDPALRDFQVYGHKFEVYGLCHSCKIS